MFSKWIIQGIDGYRFGEDKKLYRLCFVSVNGKHFETKEIKKQYPNRYRINGEWWSERQLRNKLELDPDPVELFRDIDMPF